MLASTLVLYGMGMAIKGAFLLACALLGSLALKRAAARHQILSLALLGILCLPLCVTLLPRWELNLQPAGTAELDPEHFDSPIAKKEILGSAAQTFKNQVKKAQIAATSAPSAKSLHKWLLGFYLLGLGISLLRIGRSWRAVRNSLQSATAADSAEWQTLLQKTRQQLAIHIPVRLLLAQHSITPLTVGVWRPIILLPADAASWTQTRRRLVLLHELSHIARRDWLTQTLGQVACALHFMNPLAWLALRGLRQAQEMAADDLVLQSGVRASDYADELLHIARGLYAPLSASIAMAGSCRLEGRLHRILDSTTKRGHLGWAFKWTATAATLALLWPLGTLRGWAAAPAKSAAATASIAKLHTQAASYFTSTLPQKPASVELTIDEVAQSLVEQELLEIEQRFHPRGASIVALKPQTAAILAMGSHGGGVRNLATEEAYEPASTMKVFTVAAALDAGTIDAQQRFSTDPASLGPQGRAMRDVTPADKLRAAEILAFSSNVGTVQIYRTLGKEKLLHALSRFHFGELPLLEIPASSGTSLRQDFSAAQAESISYGHTLMASPLQLAAAFAAVANHGVYNRPYLARRVLAADGRVLWQSTAQAEPLLKAATADTVLTMLEGVVENDDGTGTNARVPGYRVAGKTGTGRQSGFFVGAIPAAKPAVIILIAVDGPTGLTHSYYGNTVAAPSFARIAVSLLPHLALFENRETPR